MTPGILLSYRVEKGKCLGDRRSSLLQVNSQVGLCEYVKPVAFLRVEKIVHQFQIKEPPGEFHPAVSEHITLSFQVISDFGDGSIGKQGGKILQAARSGNSLQRDTGPRVSSRT